MPNKIEKLSDGNFAVELETGEKFSGDPLEVTTKLAEAQVNTKRWGQGFKTELDTLKASAPPPAPPTPEAQNEAQLQSYLLGQHAKALGYESADAYKADIAKVKTTTEEVNNQLVAGQFMALRQDFPNSPEAIDALSKKIDEMHWNFDVQSMCAAHDTLIREHAADKGKGYAPLTTDQINATWSQGLQNSNRLSPAPMINRGSPESTQTITNYYDPKQIKTEDLRALAIRQQLEGK